MIQNISKTVFTAYIFFVLVLITCKGIKFPMGVPSNGDPGVIERSRYLKEGSPCYTQGVEGKCLPLSKCPELRTFVSSRGGIHSKGTADILKKKICSYSFNEALLCCPSIIPTLEECGLPFVSRIFKGENFTHGIHPWLVGVGYLKSDSSIKVECGGTLITRRHVLTAAHCFVRKPEDRKIPQFTHVILGEHSLSQDIERERPMILKIAQRKNAGYDMSRYDKDIELLVLERDVTFTNYIKPACLPLNDYVKHFKFDNIEMIIAGWGRTSFNNFLGTDTPLEAFVSMVPLSNCQVSYRTANVLTIDDTQICLRGINGSDTCKGDSGGPVIYAEDGNYYRHFVVGITAFGGICGNPDLPGVYTFVPAYMDWIVKNL